MKSFPIKKFAFRRKLSTKKSNSSFTQSPRKLNRCWNELAFMTWVLSWNDGFVNFRSLCWQTTWFTCSIRQTVNLNSNWLESRVLDIWPFNIFNSSPSSGSNTSYHITLLAVAARKPKHNARTSQLFQARCRDAKFQQNVDSQRRDHHRSIVLSASLRSSHGQERHLVSGADGGAVLPFNQRSYCAIWQSMDGSTAFDWWS